MIGLAKSRGTLETDLPAITVSSRIYNLKTSTSEKAVNTTTAFSKDQNVYVRFDLNAVPADTLFEAKWYYQVHILGSDVYFLIATLTNTSKPGNTNMFFYLNNPGVKGNYHVDIYMNGILVDRRFFSVQ